MLNILLKVFLVIILIIERDVWGIDLRIYAINNGSYNILKKIEFDRQEIGGVEVDNARR